MSLPEAQPDGCKPAEAGRLAILTGRREIPKQVERTVAGARPEFGG